VDLNARYLDALVLLVRENGRLVTKDRFLDEVWKGVPVTDEALTQCIRTLRRALGDDAARPRFIATVPKHGYRFLAQVERADATKSGLSPSIARANSRGGRIAGAATIGGGLAGAIGGMFYGIVGTTGGGSAALVMGVFVAALGVLGGSAIGVGMGLAAVLRDTERSPTLIAGAAGGGLLIGALGETLGRVGMTSLTGANVVQMTGPYEGLLLGLGVGLVAWMGLSGSARRSMVLGRAVVMGGCVGAVVALSGGALLGRSLMFLEIQFPASELEMARVGRIMGESGFSMASQLTSAVLEGAIFTLCIAAMLLRLREPGKKKGDPGRGRPSW